MRETSKYFSLFTYLQQSTQDEVMLSLAEFPRMQIELPPSAYTRRGWWSNRNKGALQAVAWLEAGYFVKTVDLEAGQITFVKRKLVYHIKKVKGVVQWDGGLVKALRQHMGLTQAQLADELGVRQVTISEWETGVYAPGRATAKYLTLVAERAGFGYIADAEEDPLSK